MSIGLGVADRAARHDWRVPTISRFFGIVITMYFDDHGIPHFHAEHGTGSAHGDLKTLAWIEPLR